MLSDDDVRALAMAVPFRHRWRHWRLLYSTARDGISLQTLYRCLLRICCMCLDGPVVLHGPVWPCSVVHVFMGLEVSSIAIM